MLEHTPVPILRNGLFFARKNKTKKIIKINAKYVSLIQIIVLHLFPHKFTSKNRYITKKQNNE
ncbi:hypothetical protein EGI32_18450 [Ferruginibacter sp. HRS2-29]|nr:hypothetical protein [Ferruginibacter sp. HRS2-29]